MNRSFWGFHFNFLCVFTAIVARWPNVMERCATSTGAAVCWRVRMQSMKFCLWSSLLYRRMSLGAKRVVMSDSGSVVRPLLRMCTHPSVPRKWIPWVSLSVSAMISVNPSANLHVTL